MERPRYGEILCQKGECKNKAYYLCNGKYVCGVHSRNKEREQLKKFSKKEERKIKEEKRDKEKGEIEEARLINIKESKVGQVICTKLRMMKAPEDIAGFIKIFPNFKHKNRSDGLGLPSLSPMSLGPVEHGQPGLPMAKNIENFFQQSKCFQEEVDEEGEPTKLFYRNRLKGYQDEVPHRHKYIGKEKNKNIPLYFVWVDKEEKEHHLDYITSRQFYCNFYERLAKEEPDYEKLRKLREKGYNLQIIGYDGRDVEDLEEAYLDKSYPFGHELVLMSMLVLEEKDYPWRKYKTFDF
jgi:hypothetical protein